MTKHLCKKFESCSVPICPIDKDLLKRKYLNGESVCPWLSEYSKEHNRATLQKAIGDELYQLVATAYPNIYRSYGALKRRLDRSSHTPSRLGGDV